MFNLFTKKTPLKSLEKQHQRLLTAAMELQRKGDIPAFASKTAEAEKLYAEIEVLRAEDEAVSSRSAADR